MPLYRASKIVENFNVTENDLLYYEEEGFLHPRSTRTGRLYSESDILSLRLIIKGLGLGFNLSDMKSIMRIGRDLK